MKRVVMEISGPNRGLLYECKTIATKTKKTEDEEMNWAYGNRYGGKG